MPKNRNKTKTDRNKISVGFFEKIVLTTGKNCAIILK